MSATLHISENQNSLDLSSHVGQNQQQLASTSDNQSVNAIATTQSQA